jgi:hypothetical protein
VGKKIVGNATIDADVETTFLAISGERWPEAVGEALKDDSRVESREQLPDGGVRLVHSRALPDGVPGFLQTFLPKDGRVLQTDTWEPAWPDGSRHGTWHIAFAGAPGHVGGATWLEPDGGTTTWRVDGEAKVKIPLLGGKAEGFIAPLVEKVIQHQAPVLQALVKDEHP